MVEPKAVDSMIENRTFDEISVGDGVRQSRTVTQDDIDLFSVVSGDFTAQPARDAPTFAAPQAFHDVVAPGLLGAGLISTLLATRLPGPGTVYLSQDFRFLQRIQLGDTLTATLSVSEKISPGNEIVFACRCVDQRGEVVIDGTARVRAPTEKIRRARAELPDVRLGRHARFHALLAEAGRHPALLTAVAHPCDANALGAAVEAARAGLIVPILVGPRAKIVAAAQAANEDISAYRIVDVPHSDAAAARAVALIRSGEAALLMKGSLHTDELLHAVLDAELGLRTKRRLSHVYLVDVPGYPRPLLLTDAAVNIAPDLDDKRDIVQNAIDLARVMGIRTPCVALLSAVETVNPKLRSTVDAAALCKMADRGQITGGLVDGPLAFDNAVSPQAAAEKGIVSKVAGRADILVVPDLEAGNMLAKQLIFLAGADAAGVVVGARVPIILTSRADGERTRMASCAVAMLLANHRSAAPQSTVSA